MSGLISPLLEQAGFAKSKIALAIEWMARLDGFSQYWQLSEPVNVLAGYIVEFELVNDGLNDSCYLICNDTSTSLAVFTAYDGYISSAGTDVDIDVNGQGDAVIIHDGSKYNVTLTFREAGSFGKLASRYNVTRTLNGYMTKLKVYSDVGVLVNEIPLTNKAQGATQLATVGSVNATMVNYSKDVWEVNNANN